MTADTIRDVAATWAPATFKRMGCCGVLARFMIEATDAPAWRIAALWDGVVAGLATIPTELLDAAGREILREASEVTS